MTPPVWLYGRIGEGRRKRILGMTLQAESVSEFPDESGVLMVSGEDFVLEEIQSPLLKWIQEPGRLLLVVPPFQTGAQEIPIRWSIQYAETPPDGGSGLAALLAGEVQYRLTGDFLIDQIRNMQFSGQTTAVGYYRPRILTGVLAITVLPIWSLRAVDQPMLSQDWIARLFELSGKQRQAGRPVQPGPALTPLHFSMLLHLSSSQHETLDAALDSLVGSSVFKITRELGSSLTDDLVKLGYVKKTNLTDSGREVLGKSPYAIYLNALKEGNS
jgi:hypothetical protein